jgi:hypothetical protein
MEPQSNCLSYCFPALSVPMPGLELGLPVVTCLNLNNFMGALL